MAFTPPVQDEIVSGFVPPDPPIGEADRKKAATSLLDISKRASRSFQELIFGQMSRRQAGVARSFAQGASFGFADEAEAAIRALSEEDDREDFSTAYTRIRNEARQELAAFQAAEPKLALASEVAGGFAVPGFGTAKAVGKAATIGTRVRRGAAAGAATGALFGAGKAGEMEDVPLGVAIGTTFGAGFGAAIPAVTGYGSMAFSALRSRFSPERGAAGRISQALSRDEITPEQISTWLKEAKSLGRPARVVDVGGAAVRRELEVAAQSPGPAAQTVEKALSARNKGQITRLSRDLVRGTGMKADDVNDAIMKTMETRSAAARPVYDRAMNFSAELNDDLVNAYNTAIKTPLGKQAMGKARKILNVENFDEAPLMERIDAFKRGLDDVIGAAMRKGEKGIAGKALEVKRGLIGLVDDVNPDYKAARQIWENGSNYLGAIDRGREVLKPTFTASKLTREFAEMTNAEKEAFRIGAVDAIITRLRQQSAKEPNLIKLLRSPEMRDKLRAIMTPKAADRLDKILDLEDEMFAVASQALKGSQTAQRTAEMIEQQKQVGIMGLVEDITSLVITPMRNLVIRGVPNLARRSRERLLSRQNAVIAQRLLSEVPDELLSIPSAPAPTITGGRLIPPAIIATETGAEQ